MELGVSYIPPHHPQHIETDMRELTAIGCTEVLVALQENHVDTLTGALRWSASIARDAGIRPFAVAWGFANTFGGGRMSHRMLTDTSLWRVGRDHKPMPLACLNNPAVVDRFIEIAAVCLDHGYQGIFVDEPTIQDCFCTFCERRWSEQHDTPLRIADAQAYARFQRETVAQYTRTVCARVKQVSRDLTTITCLMPSDRDSFDSVAAIPDLDVFGTDPYWLLEGFNMTIDDAEACAVLTRQICEANLKASQIWLNAWKIPAGAEPDIYSGGKRLAAAGCDALYTWSFRGGLGTYEESDNPLLAWENVVKLYRELSGR